MVSRQELDATTQGNGWETFLDTSYQAAVQKHTGNKWSWLKTSFRKANRATTVETGANQALGAAGVVSGATSKAGTAAQGALSGSAAILPITLYAMPIAVTLIGLAYWGYKKNAASTVNKEIRDWFYQHPQNPFDPNQVLPNDQAMRWIGWFGDCGIENMGHLLQKLKEACDTFTKNFNSLDQARQQLERDREGLRTARPPQSPPQQTPQQQAMAENTWKQQQATRKRVLEQTCEDLAKKYSSLAVDYQYIRYRMERYRMYPLMLHLAVNNYTRILHDQEGNNQQLFTAFENNEAKLRTLGQHVATTSKQLDGMAF